MFDIKKIEAAINMIAAEKKIPKDSLISIIEAAIKTAYKKDYGHKDEDVEVNLDIEEGTLSIVINKKVVKTITNPYTEISFDDLGEDASSFEEGDIVEIDVTDEIINSDSSDSFGRIASQAARQVIIQKIGESEKQKIYELFKDKVGEIVNMKVLMIESGKIILDYNGNQVILPKSEQVSRDNYTPGTRLYVYVAEAISDAKSGQKVILSRKNPTLIKELFSLYVQELNEGMINIDNIVRQPGVKTKILVSSKYDEIDPAGCLIGQKGMRVKSVMDELFGEKIDVIVNNNNPSDMIIRSLTPAKILKVDINEYDRQVNVYLLSSERAKAIGKNGINVNLAHQLLGYDISIEEIKDEEEKTEEA